MGSILDEVSDIRAQQAREAHQAASRAEVEASRHRDVRNRMVRLLRAEDPNVWTYPELARAVGCSPELIAAIVKKRTGTASRSAGGSQP